MSIIYKIKVIISLLIDYVMDFCDEALYIIKEADRVYERKIQIGDRIPWKDGTPFIVEEIETGHELIIGKTKEKSVINIGGHEYPVRLDSTVKDWHFEAKGMMNPMTTSKPKEAQRVPLSLTVYQWHELLKILEWKLRFGNADNRATVELYEIIASELRGGIVKVEI